MHARAMVVTQPCVQIGLDRVDAVIELFAERDLMAESLTVNREVERGFEPGCAVVISTRFARFGLCRLRSGNAFTPPSSTAALQGQNVSHDMRMIWHALLAFRQTTAMYRTHGNITGDYHLKLAPD